MSYSSRIMLAMQVKRDSLGLLGGKPLTGGDRDSVLDEMVGVFIEEARKQWDAKQVQPPTEKNAAPIPRKRNELLDALVSLCGGDPATTTKSEFRTAAVALAEIQTVCPLLTTEELTLRCDRYKRDNRDWKLTPYALAKWWSHLGGGPRTKSEKGDIYIEPPGWKSVLMNLYGLADGVVRDKIWLDLGPDTRRDILKQMKHA